MEYKEIRSSLLEEAQRVYLCCVEWRRQRHLSSKRVYLTLEAVTASECIMDRNTVEIPVPYI
jgi:hypothetical protein